MYNIIEAGDVGSTQDELKTHIQNQLSSNPQNAALGFDLLGLVGASQNTGRGRRARHWHSPRGNLYFSFVCDTQNINPRDYPLVSFITAIAAFDALSQLCPDIKDKLSLKWPNDVLLSGGKLAGMIIENLASPPILLIGIGINLTSKPEAGDMLYKPIAVSDVSQIPPHPLALAQALLASFDHWRSLFIEKGFAPLRQKWLQHGPAIGHVVSFQTGQTRLKGNFAGIDEQGGLQLHTQNGVQSYYIGDIIGLE